MTAESSTLTPHTCIHLFLHGVHLTYLLLYMHTSVSFPHTGLRKKLEAAAKTKDCDIIGKLQKSIMNHLYWCVASSPNGDSETIKAKWLSLNNHIHNIHDGHCDIFQSCLHGPLHGHDRKKKWLKKRKLKEN